MHGYSHKYLFYEHSYTYCPVEIGFERLTYVGTEADETTEEICAVILANPASFVGGSLQGTFADIGITTITGTITPQETTGANAATSMHAKSFYMYTKHLYTLIIMYLICLQ